MEGWEKGVGWLVLCFTKRFGEFKGLHQRSVVVFLSKMKIMVT